MEAAPRLPMLSFELKVSPEKVNFGPKLKQYIANFYGEDPDTYTSEINNLESLRNLATHAPKDVSGVQLLKKYYCQLHFLKSRFPMEEGQPCAVQFVWEDGGISSGLSDIRYELIAVLYNIGALHSYLGASDSRSNPDGMKMACTHFQCAVWAFQYIKEKFNQFVQYISSLELIHVFQQICLAQAQECILEKSMLDNRKPTIIAKVAVQVYDYYRQSLAILQSTNDEVCGKQNYREWSKYLQFKIAYHRCISLLFQGQQAEEQQKMGERVAFYQAACDHLEEARKLASNLKNNQKELLEALAFTLDVVEGKRKAAKNENEFIYHEEVPELSQLQEVKGASLVKGIPFSVNDVEVSGPDIFARLVPMEAHEAASLYSEKKAQVLRQIGELVETKDQALAEFMSSMQLDLLTKMHQATGIPQDIVDRAASLSARTTATQDLVDIMGKLSNIYQEVEANLNEIDAFLKDEDESEKSYQEIMGKRPPSIIATDLAREAAKYREAHTKANESNQALHRAMMTHVANLKILQQPLKQLQQQLPTVELPNSNIDEKALKNLEMLNVKVEEMRTQRAMLWAQLRDSVHKDDITGSLVTKPPNQPLEELFQKELEKHQQLIGLIQQNIAAQENIRKAFVDAYAESVNTRRFIQDIIQKRTSTIHALIASHDSYEDLVAKANKGIEFYTKLETNVSKLLQRIKSACKVQQEEREQMLSKMNDSKIKSQPPSVSAPAAPKLKDYLEARQKSPVVGYVEPSVQYPQVNYGVVPQNTSDTQSWPPAVRPAPVGSETCNVVPKSTEAGYRYGDVQYGYGQMPQSGSAYPYQNNDSYSSSKADPYSNHTIGYSSQISQSYPTTTMDNLANRMGALLSKTETPTSVAPQNYPSYSYSSYVPGNYITTYSTQAYSGTTQVGPSQSVSGDPSKAYTSTTDSYHPISSHMPNSDTTSGMQYPASSLGNDAAGGKPLTTGSYPTTYQYSSNVNYSPQSTSSNVGYQQQQQQISAQSTSYPQQASQDLSYSTQTYTDTAYFPPGYSPAYNEAAQATSQNTYVTPQLYHSQEYATSVRPDVVNFNYSTYSSPIVNMSNSQATTSNHMSTGVSADNYSATSTTPSNYPTASYQSYTTGYTGTPQDATLSQVYGSYPGYGQQSNYYNSVPASSPGYMYNYPANTPQPVQQNESTTQSVQQNLPSTQPVQQNVASTQISGSNIDLLSGLDFSINQAPLVPQQKALAEPQKDTVNLSVSESKITQVKVKQEDKPSVKTSCVKILPSQPLNNNDVRYLFNHEVERYEKQFETLTNKTLSGPTNLDIKWKEIQDKQDHDSQKRIISVARCYPMKNRFADILPYDYSRVELKDAKDDYINASYVKEVSPFAPQFIVTQAPLPSTFGDFWTMIREQQVELIFCLLNDNEVGEEVYWPREKGKNLSISNMELSLQSVIVKPYWTERLISVMVPERRESWIVMHLQLTCWPGSLFPTNPEPFVNYVLELINVHQQQKCVTHPIVVHCSSGIGRSGLVCLLTTCILDVTNNANSIPDLAALTSKLTNWKRNILRDREHLKFAYEAFLCYMKQVVSQDKMKKRLNEVVPKQEEEKKKPTIMEIKEANVDPLSSLDPFWANKK